MSEFKNVLNDSSELVGYSYQVTEGNVTKLKDNNTFEGIAAETNKVKKRDA